MDLDTVMVYRFFTAGAEPSGRLTKISSKPNLNYEMNQVIAGYDIDISINDSTIGLHNPDGTPVRHIRDIVDVNYFVYIDFIKLGAETTVSDNQILDSNNQPIYDSNNQPILDTRQPSTVYGQDTKTIFQGYVTKIFTALDGSGVRVSVRSHSQTMADIKVKGITRVDVTNQRVVFTRQDTRIDYTDPRDDISGVNPVGVVSFEEIGDWVVQSFTVTQLFTVKSVIVSFKGQRPVFNTGGLGIRVILFRGRINNPLAVTTDQIGLETDFTLPLASITSSQPSFRDYEIPLTTQSRLTTGTYTLAIICNTDHQLNSELRLSYSNQSFNAISRRIIPPRRGIDRARSIVTNRPNPLYTQILGDRLVSEIRQPVTSQVPLVNATPTEMARIILEYVSEANPLIDYEIDNTITVTETFDLNLNNVTPLEALRRIAAIAGAYFYCDYGTSTIHFRALANDVRVLPKDSFSDSGGIERNLEKAVTEALFIGGKQRDGTTLYVSTDTTGDIIRPKVREIRDARIVDIQSARAISRQYLAANEGVIKSGEIEIIRNKHFDIEDIRPGDLVSLSGVSMDIDTEELRIAKFTYDGQTLKCKLGYIPPRVEKETTDNKESIAGLGDIDIAITPSS